MSLVLLGFPDEVIVPAESGIHGEFYACRPTPGFVAAYWPFRSGYMLRIWSSYGGIVSPRDFILSRSRGSPILDESCDSVLQVQAIVFDFVQKQGAQ